MNQFKPGDTAYVRWGDFQHAGLVVTLKERQAGGSWWSIEESAIWLCERALELLPQGTPVVKLHGQTLLGGSVNGAATGASVFPAPSPGI